MEGQVRVWEANALMEEFSGASPESLASLFEAEEERTGASLVA